MANTNILNKRKNSKVISYMLIILSFLFLIIVTKSMNYDIQIASDSLSQAKIDLTKKQKDLSDMNKIKSNLANDAITSQTLSKFESSISEQDLINYFFTYSYKLNSWVSINNMTMEKWSKNEIWFMQSNLNLSVTFRDEIAMQSFINFLTNESSKYSFILENFSYPYGEKNKDFQVSIPLKILYY